MTETPKTPIEEMIDTSKITPEQRIDLIKSLIRADLSYSDIAAKVKKSDGTPISESYVYKIRRAMVAAGELAKPETIETLKPETPSLIVEKEEKKLSFPPTPPPTAPPKGEIPPIKGEIPIPPTPPEIWKPEVVKVLTVKALNGIFKRINAPLLDSDEEEAITTAYGLFFDKYGGQFSKHAEIFGVIGVTSMVIFVRLDAVESAARNAIKNIRGGREKTEEIPPGKATVPVGGKPTKVESKGKRSEELPAWKKEKQTE